MSTDDDDPVESAVQLHGAALGAMGEGALERARALAGEALAIFTVESGEIHPDVANVLNCLAHIHEQAADYASAEATAVRSVDIMRRVREQAGGEDIDRLYVQSLTGLGDVVRIRGRYDEAEPYLREAIAIGESSFGGEDADVVTALNSLAVLFKYSGRFDARHPKVVACAKNYAGLLRAAGRDADARAIEVRYLSEAKSLFNKKTPAAFSSDGRWCEK